MITNYYESCFKYFHHIILVSRIWITWIHHMMKLILLQWNGILYNSKKLRCFQVKYLTVYLTIRLESNNRSSLKTNLFHTHSYVYKSAISYQILMGYYIVKETCRCYAKKPFYIMDLVSPSFYTGKCEMKHHVFKHFYA